MVDEDVYKLPFTIEGQLQSEPMNCPICGFEYVHFGKPTYKSGEDDYKAGWGGRGDLITIPMHCEDGCEWELSLGFHKGQVFPFLHQSVTQRG